MAKTDLPSMYCKQCGYCLHGLTVNRCPECGRGFDPADPATFLSRRRRKWLRRVVVSAGLLGVLLAVAYGGLIGWVYLGWRNEAAARSLFPEELAHRQTLEGIWTRPCLPPLLSRLLPTQCRHWQERVDWVSTTADLSHEQIRAIGACSRLRSLWFCSVRLNGEDVAALCRCEALEEVTWRGAGLGHGDIAPLSRLAHLRALDLHDNGGLDDADLAALAELKNLKSLALIGTSITGTGFSHLAKLQGLEELDLWGCGNVTDAAVPHLIRLQGLRDLNVSETQLTPDAIRRLKVSLPNCKVSSWR